MNISQTVNSNDTEKEPRKAVFVDFESEPEMLEMLDLYIAYIEQTEGVKMTRPVAIKKMMRLNSQFRNIGHLHEQLQVTV